HGDGLEIAEVALQPQALSSHAAGHDQPKNLDRTRDIPQRSIPKMLEGILNFVTYLIISGLRQENSPRVRQSFQSRRDIDAIAEDVAILDHDVADIDADPQLDALRSFGFTAHFGYTVLNRDRTFDGINGAGKFQQKAVTHGFHEPTAAGFDGGVDDDASQGAHRAER